MRGPATLTDELASPPGCERTRRDGYTVVRTPACPTFHSGNCLVLDEPPVDPEEWVRRFEQEHPDMARIHIEWETHELDGCAASVNHLGPVAPLRRPADVQVRLLEEEDWQAQFELAHAIVEERFPGSRPYAEWRNAARREACAQGRCRWWGAFAGDELVGSAGLYETDRWARFQTVLTATARRGRGVCTTLVHAMAQEVSSRRPGDEVILVAATDSQAERIYRSIGFVRIGAQHELSRPASPSSRSSPRSPAG